MHLEYGQMSSGLEKMGGAITRKRKQKYVWLDKRIQNIYQLLTNGELSNLEFLEVAHPGIRSNSEPVEKCSVIF
jgi:hypothetical protein